MRRPVVNRNVRSPDRRIGSARQFNSTPSSRSAKTVNPASCRELKRYQKPRSDVSVRDGKAKPQSRQQGKSIPKIESNYRLKQGHNALASEESYMETTQGDLDTGTKQLNMKKPKVQTGSTKRENVHKTDAKIADELCTEADENCWTTETQSKAEASLKLASKIKNPRNGHIMSYPNESNVLPNKPVHERSSVSDRCRQTDVCLCIKQTSALQTVEENSLQNSSHDSRLERTIRQDFMFLDRNDILPETEVCTRKDLQRQRDLENAEILTKHLKREKERADSNERENDRLTSCLKDLTVRYRQETEVLKQEVYRLKEENRVLQFKCTEAESNKNENSAIFEMYQTKNSQLGDEINILKDILFRKNKDVINLENKFEKLLKDRDDRIYCLQLGNSESEKDKRQVTELFKQVVKLQSDNADRTKDLKEEKHYSETINKEREGLLKENNDLKKGQEEKDAICNLLRNEKTELEEHFSKLCRSYSQLQTQLRKVQEENSTFAEVLRLGEEKKRNESEENVRQLMKELKEEKQLVNSNEEEIIRYRKNCEDLQQRLKDLTEEKEGVERKLIVEECKHAEYKEESTKKLTQWKVKLTETDNRLANEMQRNVQLNEMNGNLQIQVQKLQEKAKILGDYSHRAKDDKQQDLESIILTLRNKINNLEKDRRELLRKTEEQNEELNKEIVRSEKIENKFDEIRKDVHDKLEKQACDISALNAGVNHRKVMLRETETHLEDEMQRCSELKEMNGNLLIQIQELQEKAKLLSDNSPRAKDDKQKELEIIMIVLRNKIINLENDRRELLRKNEEQKEELNKEVVRSKKKKNKFDEMRKEMQDKLEKQACDISALNAEVTHWKGKLTETDNRLASEMQRYGHVNEMNGNLQIQIQELQEKARLLSDDSQRAKDDKQKELESIILTLRKKLTNLENDRRELLRISEEQKKEFDEIRTDMEGKLENQACDISTLTAELYKLKQVEKDKLGLQEKKLIELQMVISNLEEENRIQTQDNENVTARLKSIQEEQEKELSLMKNELVSQTKQNQNLHSTVNLLHEEKQKMMNENLLLSEKFNKQEKEYKETLHSLQLESGKQMETNILKYDSQLRHLQEENQTLRLESSESKKQKEKLDAVNKLLNDELHQCKKEVKSLEVEKASLNETVEQMQHIKKRHDSIISELHKKNELREQELSSFTSETKLIERTKKENVELQENLRVCKQELEKIKAEITSSESKLHAMRDGYESRISMLNQEIKEKTVELDQIEKGQRSKIDSQTKQFRQIQDEKEHMSVRLEKAKGDIERLMESLETAKQNELQLNQEKCENLKQLHELQTERKTMQDSYRTLEDNLRVQEKSTKMLEMKLQDTKYDNEKLYKENKTRIVHLNEEIISLKSANDKLTVEKTRETEFLKEEVSRLQIDRITQLQICKENQQLRDKLDCVQKETENSSKALEQEKLRTEKCNQKHLKLQQEVERRENETARLRHDLHACSEKQSEFSKCISELQEENKRLNGNVSFAKQNLAQVKSEIERLNAENGKLENTLQQQIQENREVLSAAKINMEEESGTISRMHQTIATQKEDIDKLRSENQMLKTSVRQTDNERSKLMKQWKDSDGDLKQQLRDTTEQLNNVQKELDDTKTRLSRAMGDRLTDNNPNITDLSDKNRPTKISERYQELYDNQWTDAFEVVDETNENEKISIEVLKDILMDTMTFCKQEAERQMKQLVCTLSKGKDIPVQLLKQLKDARKSTAETYGKQVFEEYKMKLSGSRSERDKTACEVMDFVYECFQVSWLMAVQDPPVVLGPDIATGETFNKDHYKAYTKSGTTIQYIGKDIPAHLLKQLKDARKSTAETYGNQILEEYMYKIKIKESRSDRDNMACKVLDFVDECFQVSWLMAVQDPPVVLGPDIATGETFNKDHYKAYTKGGTTIKYIVWPVLLLHQGGPVLCKGVAQG